METCSRSTLFCTFLFEEANLLSTILGEEREWNRALSEHRIVTIFSGRMTLKTGISLEVILGEKTKNVLIYTI